MSQQTTDKIRQIIMDQYGCDDTFTPESRLDGSIILGDSFDAAELEVRLDDELDICLLDTINWKTVQDVFDSVEAAL